MLKNLREKLIGEYGGGKSFTTSTAWVKENDIDTYDFLLDMMEGFVNDESNRTYEEDLEEFENGNWEVEYTFRSGRNDAEIEVLIVAGRNGQHIANQSAWIQETVSIKELKENWEIEAYIAAIYL